MQPGLHQAIAHPVDDVGQREVEVVQRARPDEASGARRTEEEPPAEGQGEARPEADARCRCRLERRAVRVGGRLHHRDPGAAA